MTRTICLPVDELLAPRVAIESAATGFPDAIVGLVECMASGRHPTNLVVSADGSGGRPSELPPDASDTLAALAHEATNTHGIECRTATTTGPFGPATVAHAELTGANMIIVGVEREKAESDSKIRNNIDYIKSTAKVPYSIVRS